MLTIDVLSDGTYGSDLFPAHIVNSLKCIHPLLEERSPYVWKLQRITDRFKKAILNIEINQTFHKIKSLKHELSKIQLRLTNATNNDIATRFITTQNQSFESRKESLKHKSTAKINLLITRSASPNNSIPTLNEKAIFNATTVTVPPDTLALLSLGPKFSLPVTNIKQIPFYHLLADVEAILHVSPDQAVQDRNRCQVATQIQNYISKAKHNEYKSPLHDFCKHATTTTAKFLTEHQDICILEADKGNRTVIMYKKEYDNKMYALLNEPAYQTVSKDPTPSVQRQNNSLITRLLNLKLIDTKTSMRLKSNTAVCPRIYGQPKAHKPNLPLRPVVPNITAPTYQLAKFIGSILKSSFHSEYNTPDSFQFTEYIQQVTLPPDYVLVSFDVVSLYTNIPTELVTHDIIMDWRNIKVHTNINLDLFLELVEFCIKSSYFRFREKHYKQTFGTAMGSPLSPILADIIMENLLQTSIKRLPFTIPVIRKYVDDLFLALPKDKVQQTLDTFNAYNQHLQFTKEEEIDNKLPFLDTVVTRHSDQTLSTRWYAKPIASGRLLNYHSFHPLSMKMNVAQQFIKRVTGLTTDNCPNLQQNIIFQHLRRNNYPSSLINRLISRNAKIFCPSNNSQQPDKNKNASNTRDPPNDSSPSTDQVYRSLPYVPSLSTSIVSILKSDYPNVKIASKPISTTSKLMLNVKDPVDPLLQSNVIYSLPCGNCPMYYIGMTRNQLKTRLYGHKTNINQYVRLKTDGAITTDEQLISLGEKTALIEHMIKNDHNFDLTKAKIIDKTYRSTALPILEMCHISNTANTFNHRTDVDGLNTTYAGILHTLKTTSTRRNRNTETSDDSCFGSQLLSIPPYAISGSPSSNQTLDHFVHT
ncbi:uncharacterized protein LOC131680001 [Topomyia yanbarensis]|uniref:uncharacterized protein LOC131680001 n=1 Tax=Topomyia yanbarensis TaxID=2498891 RepID=UPI00273BEEEF|nr:uncharacterized protein LOC131680001 [Topomyia yanbarensis]